MKKNIILTVITLFLIIGLVPSAYGVEIERVEKYYQEPINKLEDINKKIGYNIKEQQLEKMNQKIKDSFGSIIKSIENMKKMEDAGRQDEIKTIFTKKETEKTKAMELLKNYNKKLETIQKLNEERAETIQDL